MADMKEARPIRYEDAAELRQVEGWVCRTCGRWYGEDEHLARWCCATDLPCACGGRRRKLYTICEACRGAKQAARERDRLEKASTVDYAGPFFVGAQLYSDLGAYLDDCDEEGVCPEAWAFVPVRTPLALDADAIVDDALDRLGIDYQDAFATEGMEALRVAVEAFNRANADNCVYHEAYRRKFRLRPDPS